MNISTLFQVRHSKQLELKKLIDLPILLHFKLSSSITLEATASRWDVIGGPKVSTRVLKPGIVTPVYLRALSDDKYVHMYICACLVVYNNLCISVNVSPG